MKKLSLSFLIPFLLIAVACSKEQAPEDARKQLGAMNVQYNEASFIDAAANGDMVAVKLFLNAGMSPDARDSMNRIAYDFASTKNYTVEYQEALNKLGSDKKLPTTALMAAAIKGRIEIVKYLIEQHADINAVDRAKMTALKYAESEKQDAVVGILEKSTLASGEATTPLPAITDTTPKNNREEKAFMKVNELLKRIQNGEDFTELAKRYTEDAAGKEKGGDLDYFGRGTMVPEFEASAFRAKIGEVVIAKTQFGYHLIKVNDRKNEGTNLEKIKAQHILIEAK